MKFSRFDFENQLMDNLSLSRTPVLRQVQFLSNKAFIALARPAVCPCNAYEWLHRKGTGRCGRAGEQGLNMAALKRALERNRA